MQAAKIGMSFMLLALAALDAASAASLLHRGGHAQGHPRRTSGRKHLAQPKVEELSAMEHLVLNMGKSMRDGNSSAAADIQELLSGFEEAINNSHTAAQTMLDNFLESFTNCTSAQATGNADAGTLNTTKNTLFGVHKDCRTEEVTDYLALQACNKTVQTLKGIYESKDNAYEDFVKRPNVNLVPQPTDGESYAAWLGRVNTWATDTLAELNTKHSEAKAANIVYSGNESECLSAGNFASTIKVWGRKRDLCNQEQDSFEAAVCTYTTKVTDVCDDHKQCHTAAKNSYDSDLPNLKAAETSRKNEWWMIQRIKCYFSVMTQAGDGNVDNAAMEACKTTSPNTNFLNLKEPTIPNPPSACTTLDAPCSDEFVSSMYGSLSSNAPANDCTPCGGDA